MTLEVFNAKLAHLLSEWDRGLMVFDEMQERIVFLTAEYLGIK